MILRPANSEQLARELRALSSGPVEAVDLTALHRILEHTPEDMTVTVEAGITVAALQAALAARGQWLPIDPPHPGRLTIAALLDANVSGPRRCGHGTIREHLIGLRVALADGRLIRSGGKVVKNVAGYDLMKLFIGAHGTLGVIVEATFKLLPVPEAEAFVQARCESLEHADALLNAVLESELTPTVLDAHRGVISDDDGPSVLPLPRGGGEGRGEGATRAPAIHLVAGFSGPRTAVDWQLALATKLGFTEPASLAYDAGFHAPELPPSNRLSVLPSRLVETVRLLGDAPFVARAANGLIYHRASVSNPSQNLPRELMRRVKHTFDPRGIFPELAL